VSEAGDDRALARVQSKTALRKRMRLAISDPGAFVVRGGMIKRDSGKLVEDPNWTRPTTTGTSR
jgi:hypothetical protein